MRPYRKKLTLWCFSNLGAPLASSISSLASTNQQGPVLASPLEGPSKQGMKIGMSQLLSLGQGVRATEGEPGQGLGVPTGDPKLIY